MRRELEWRWDFEKTFKENVRKGMHIPPQSSPRCRMGMLLLKSLQFLRMSLQSAHDQAAKGLDLLRYPDVNANGRGSPTATEDCNGREGQE